MAMARGWASLASKLFTMIQQRVPAETCARGAFLRSEMQAHARAAAGVRARVETGTREQRSMLLHLVQRM